ncbi:flagellar hook-length control protein FliK [Onishia taeanensis]|uniref:Flagellar hook-length control protein FliK n=1 Tax=Onishia taeanensis TaxID=284577 RepID=A0A1G7RDC4_9GAMM|nr:flagellar hook-length control protein FliK [Halomonas taeanensis]MAX33361.1 flagellar hook-length control protein FliK [Halomonadaceae bacterium]SDG08777.1 flagellar hook-length control protein FliK [Halomonas taeanensis]
MDIIDVMSAPGSSSKATGRQANGAQQGAAEDFGALLSQRQTLSDGKQNASSAQALSHSQDTPLARLKQAVSALSPEQLSALKEQLQQDPAQNALTASQREALAALLDGKPLGEKASQDLSQVLSALEALPNHAQKNSTSDLDGSQTWLSDVDTGTTDSSMANGASPDATPSTDVNDGPLGLAMIAARMNLIDQAGSSTSNGEKLALAGQATANADARRDQAPLSQAALNTDWLNRSAMAQAVSDSAATAANRQSMAGFVASDSAAASLLADRADARGAAFSSSSASSDLLAALSSGDRLSGMAGTGATPASLATSAQAQIGSGALTAPIASQQWQQQLGQQLLGMTQRGDQQMELKLHPADLGPLSVSLKVAEHGGAQAQFLSAHAQVRNALEQAIPQLRDALAQQGITLGDTSVGHQASGQQPQEQSLAGRQSQGPGILGDTDEGAVDPRSMLSSTTTNLMDGRVDLYA